MILREIFEQEGALPLCQRGISSKDKPGNTKGGSITVLLTSCLTGLELAV